MFQYGRGSVWRSVLWLQPQSLGVTVLFEVRNASQYSKESQTLVLGHNFLTFALQFTVADVSVP
jgi:hypothetical protein